jgi:cell division protein FtsQ
MWDNPRLLNLAANVLFGIALALFAYAGLQALLRSPLFPLQEVVVRGDLKNVDRGELSNALDGIGGNFFAADLGAVRGRLEQVTWVRRVDARRVWPNRIEVQLEEHVAFARWGDSGLVNTFGEPFSASLAPALQAEMPLFAGPVGTEGEVARRYRRFVELLAPLQATPERVVLTPRHAWQLRLSTGMYIELGRDGAERVEQRLERFVAAYPASLGQLGRSRFERVDLRYPNGFALRVSGLKS